MNSWLTVDERRRIFRSTGVPVMRTPSLHTYPTTFEASLDEHVADLCGLEEARFTLAQALFLQEDWDHFFVLFSSTDWLGHAATGLFLDGDPGRARRSAASTRSSTDTSGGFARMRPMRPSSSCRTMGNAKRRMSYTSTASCAIWGSSGSSASAPPRSRPSSPRAGSADRPHSAGFRRLRSSRLLRTGARFLARAAGALGVELATPDRGLEVDRVLSRAFTPTVASYAVYTRSCDEGDLGRVRAALAGLRLDDGRPAFDGVWTLEELHGRVPAPSAPTFVYAPSLGVRPSIRVREPLRRACAQTRTRSAPARRIAILAGQDVIPGELERPSLTDLSPTLLWLMGAPIPADADGRVLFEVFAADAVASREVREVDSAAGDRGVPRAGSSVEVERRLRDLGHL